MTSSLRKCGDISLYVTEYGPADGPLVVLLHGFPDFSMAWRFQVPALVAAGYRVIVPDQRGYNLSDKPKGIAAYDLDRLAGDVIALAASYGHERFDVVGHDWGAAVAWWLAANFPSHVGRAAMINAPHPAVWRNAMNNIPEQRRLSWYVRFLTLPWLPELILGTGHFAALVTSIKSSKTDISEAELDAYRATWAQPGALNGMINWYRALLRRSTLDIPPLRSIEPPVLIIWGIDDPYALAGLAERSARLCADGRIDFIRGAGHWAMWDQPVRVNGFLLEFLGQR